MSYETKRRVMTALNCRVKLERWSIHDRPFFLASELGSCQHPPSIIFYYLLRFGATKPLRGIVGMSGTLSERKRVVLLEEDGNRGVLASRLPYASLVMDELQIRLYNFVGSLAVCEKLM